MEETKSPEGTKPKEKPAVNKDTKLPSKAQATTDKKRKPATTANVNQQSQQKTKKKKAKREDGAPKLPLTGYLRYINERRDSVRTEFPDKSVIEHTKLIADEWNRLTEEQKKPYLHAAELDRERYNQEMDEYNKQKENEKKKLEKTEVQNDSTPSPTAITNGTKSNIITERSQINGKDISVNSTKLIRRSGEFGIPIFTEEFLEHNKTVDLELRTLRKSNIDYEQQNSVLEKHIESMKFGVEKLESENNELLEKNRLLEAYLEKFKAKLVQAFSGLAIPGQSNGATSENIDKYMADLYSMATSNSHGPASLNKAKDIIRKLDLQIQL